jgi:hypothetical protein
MPMPASTPSASPKSALDDGLRDDLDVGGLNFGVNDAQLVRRLDRDAI